MSVIGEKRSRSQTSVCNVTQAGGPDDMSCEAWKLLGEIGAEMMTAIF